VRGRILLLGAVVLGLLISAPAFASSPAGAPVGNAGPALGPSDGRVSAAATSAPVDDRVAVLIRNGSTKTARVDLVTVTATSRDGGTVVKARSLEAFPQVLAPGELALASVKFRAGEVAPGAAIAAKIRSTPVGAARAARALTVGDLALSPPQTGSVAQTMTTTVSNPTSSWPARSPKVAVMCFGEATNPVAVATAPLTKARLAPGTEASVSVPLPTLCPTYLVAARAT
jgi:hypothetical protein